MQVNWTRGFLRVWGVLSMLWITISGWHEYPTNGFSTLLAAPSWEVGDDCWKQIAKWPDGKPFTDFWDALDAYDPSSNVEINKRSRETVPDSIPKNNRWRRAIRHQLDECAHAKSTATVMERLALNVSNNWITALKNSILFILSPPLVLLVVGYGFYWIVRGFRMSD